MDGRIVKKNYEVLKVSKDDGRCDRITVDIKEKTYIHEEIEAGLCYITASPTLSPTDNMLCCFI